MILLVVSMDSFSIGPMNKLTAAKFEELEKADFFAAVGQPGFPDAKVVSSWLEAMAICSGEDWSAALIEGLNLLSARVRKKSNERDQQWNNSIRELRPMLLDFAGKKTASVSRENNLPQKFADATYASLLGVALECEYGDLVEPGFFQNTVAECYVKGHFPCGWEGKFPKGQLIIY